MVVLPPDRPGAALDPQEMVSLLDQLQEQLDVWDAEPDAAPVSGDSPEADENRAIRGAHASLARQRAREVRAPMARLREHAIEMRRRVQGLPGSTTPAGSSPESYGDRLTAAIGSAVRELFGDESVEDALEHAVRGALGAVPGATRAGVSVMRGRRVESCAPSDDVVAELDALQAELGEGPCWDAAASQQRVHVPDIGQATDRWTRFAAAAADRGVGSIVAFPLAGRSGPAGALNLYGASTHAFDELGIDIGAVFASHVSLALVGAERMTGMNHAISTRDMIGQGKGILMERFGLDGAQAFALLVRSSQDTNVKLVDVARWLVEEKTRAQGTGAPVEGPESGTSA